jgi:rhodanese-related sulfurtransferase
VKKLLLSILPLTFILAACGSSGGTVTNLNVSDFAKKVSDTSVVVLDVRTAGEFQSGHLQNAVNIDYEGLNFEGEVNKLDKTKTYAVYCRSGRRSGLATQVMAKDGFKSIFNLDGGIENWQAAGNPVVNN